MKLENGPGIDNFFGGVANGRARRWVPPMDLLETEDALVLKADLPGLERDDVAIEIRDGVLNVSGERDRERRRDRQRDRRGEVSPLYLAPCATTRGG